MKVAAAPGLGFFAGLLVAGYVVGRNLAEGRTVGGYTWERS